MHAPNKMRLKDELELIVNADEDISRLDNALVTELLDIADILLTNDRKSQARIHEARRALSSPKYLGGNAETLAIDFPEDWQDWCMIVLNHLQKQRLVSNTMPDATNSL